MQGPQRRTVNQGLRLRKVGEQTRYRRVVSPDHVDPFPQHLRLEPLPTISTVLTLPSTFANHAKETTPKLTNSNTPAY